MHRTVLAVATDPHSARTTLTLAVALGRPLGADVVLAGVIIPDVAHPWAEEYPAIERLHREVRAVVDQAPHDVPVTADETVAASMPGAVRQLVERHAAQLLVVARHPDEPLHRVLFDDGEAAMIRAAGCGVAFAGLIPEDGPPRRIGVAWAPGPEAGEALEWSVQLAERTAGTVDIVHVLAHDHDESAELSGELRRLQDAVAQRVPAETHVVRGGPSSAEYVQLTERLDLLVTGARGRGGVRAALLGSFSQATLRCAQCPVVVLPRGVHVPVDTAAV